MIQTRKEGDEDDKSMPDLCREDDLCSSDAEDETRSYLQLCFAIGDDIDMEVMMGDESNDKSQQLFELSKTEDFYLHQNDEIVAPARQGRNALSYNFPTYHENKAIEAKTSSTGTLSFRSNLRKSRSVSLLAVECSATSSPLFDSDKSEKTEDSDDSDNDYLQTRGRRVAKKNHFPSTSTHSTSSAGSVSQSIVQLRRKLKDRSVATRRPMWSSSLTSSLSSGESKRQEQEAADDSESCIENRARRSRMGSAKSCADAAQRSRRAPKSSASCAEVEKRPRSRRGSSASVQLPSNHLEPVVNSRRSSGSSVQGIITFVSEATSSHKRSPTSTAQTGRTTLLARLPSSRVGRRSSACSDAGDVDPPLLGADHSSRRSSAKSSSSSVILAAKEEMLHRTRKVESSTRRERRSKTLRQTK